MAKRNLPSSAFALPGLTTTGTGSRKPLGIHNTKQIDDGYSFIPTTNVAQKYENSDQLNDRITLVDDQGVLLAPQTAHTLEHLTKSRPRSSGRRSPSPFARRKFDDSGNANGSLDSLRAEGNVKKPTKHQRDFKSDQVKSLDERSSFSPSLIITNDVGLSVSTAALAKPPNKQKSNGKNDSASFPTVGKISSLKNEEITVAGQMVNETTISSKFSEMVDSDGPPPVPSVPPPLEDDFPASVDQKPLHQEVEHLSQAINANRPCKTDARIESKSLVAKLESDTNHSSESPGIERFSRKRPSMINSTGSDKRISGFTSRETNAGLLRMFSEDTTAHISALPTDGIGTLDKKVSLNSRILKDSWSSRQRNPVDKGQSARRRRFKPVTLSNDLELNDADNPALYQDSPNTRFDLINPVRTLFHTGTQGPMHGHPDKSSENRDPIGNSVGSMIVDRHSFMADERSENLAHKTSEVQQFSNTPLSVNGPAESAVNSDHLFSFRPEKNDLSGTTTPESTVGFEHDNSSVLRKIEGDNRGDKSISSDIEMGATCAVETEERSVAIDGTVDTVGNINNRSVHQLKHPSITLPKVVIEYDGEIISDPVIDGYITAETSSDNTATLASYSPSNTHSDMTKQGMEGSNHAFHRSVSEENGSSNDDASLEDLEDLHLKQEDHTSVESQEGGMEKFQETEYFDKDEDGLMYQPAQVITELNHLAEDDEMLFHPPPMFASSDEEAEGEEGDNEEEPEEGDEEQKDEEEEEKGESYGIRSSSPAIPSSLLEEQTRDDRPFHNLALEAWSEEDCIEWLEFIGLEHFTGEFREHHVDGRMLTNVNLQLLEEIGIHSPDEREVILSEIYRRFHPEEEDMFEMEVQDAFESATEQEKMKIVAVLNALRSPVFQAELGMASSTGSSSPRDSEAGFHATSETASLSGSLTGSDDLTRDDVMPPPPPPPTWTNASHGTYVSYSARGRSESRDSRPKEEERIRKSSKGKERSIQKERKTGHGHKHKKHKGVSKLLDSLSLGSGSSKLAKLFHSSSSSKKLNPAMQYLLQAGPQGLVRIWPMALSEETNYCSFLVSMTTTCREVVRLVFEKYEPIEDPRRFYICEVNLGKGGAHHNLSDDDCPLLYQCRWQDPEKYRFELRCREEGVIKILFELDEYEGDLDYRSIPLSMKTPCSEALSLIVKKFTLPGVVSDYFLMEVSEENEDDREEVADHVCPLPLQRAWSAPDHVFRLCRRAALVRDENTESGGTAQTTEDISQEPNIYTQSDASSVRDELESAAEIDGKEGDVVIEDTSRELMEGITEFEESDDQTDRKSTRRTASENLTDDLQKLFSKDLELQELRSTSNVLLEKDREIENLKRQNEELRRRYAEYGDLTVINKRLGEKERDFKTLLRENEELRKSMSELQEKSRNEILMRDREIERLYSRNNELCSSEKELLILREKSKDFDSQEEELEKLRQLQYETNSTRDELVMKLEQLQNRHNEMSLEVRQVEELKRINRELCQNVDEGQVVRQELKRSEAEVKEFRMTIEELERRNKELEGVCDEVDSLRKENNRLAVSSKDAEEMKKNVIKLSAQLREMESRDEVERLRKALEQSEAEKQQLVDKVAEKQDDEVKENSKEVEDLKLENIFLVERAKELDELKVTVAKLTGQVRENESFRQKYKELRDVESFLTKQTSALESTVRQRDKKLKESENRIKNLTEAMKDMEAKLEEQEQNRLYLDQLLSMLKDRDPGLLHLMNSSLASSEPEEWC